VPSGKEERWFPGPKGRLACDGDLFSWNELDGLAVWEVATGARLAAEPGLCPMGYHPGSKQFLSFPGDRTVRVSWLVQE
jgi:hypothetical protein